LQIVGKEVMEVMEGIIVNGFKVAVTVEKYSIMVFFAIDLQPMIGELDRIILVFAVGTQFSGWVNNQSKMRV
jgi:hypothetical protein